MDESSQEIHTSNYEIHKYYLEHFNEYTVPFPGMVETLKKLKDAGIHLSVVSNKVDHMAQDLCKRHYTGIFEEVLAIKDGVRPKPDPAMCLQVINNAETVPEKTLYVGDTEYDVETARNVGMDCMLVRWGYRDEEFLENAGAEYLVSDADEMASIILGS